MELYSPDPYWPPIVILTIWFICAMFQIGMEALIWNHRSAHPVLNKVTVFFAYILELPILASLAIYLIGHFDPGNLQFITYNILMIAYGMVILFGALGIKWIHRRKGSSDIGSEDDVKSYSRLVRMSFLITLLFAFLAIAAKFHIENDWITNLFN